MCKGAWIKDDKINALSRGIVYVINQVMLPIADIRADVQQSWQFDQVFQLFDQVFQTVFSGSRVPSKLRLGPFSIKFLP